MHLHVPFKNASHFPCSQTAGGAWGTVTCRGCLEVPCIAYMHASSLVRAHLHASDIPPYHASNTGTNVTSLCLNGMHYVPSNQLGFSCIWQDGHIPSMHDACTHTSRYTRSHKILLCTDIHTTCLSFVSNSSFYLYHMYINPHLFSYTSYHIHFPF